MASCISLGLSALGFQHRILHRTTRRFHLSVPVALGKCPAFETEHGESGNTAPTSHSYHRNISKQSQSYLSFAAALSQKNEVTNAFGVFCISGAFYFGQVMCFSCVASLHRLFWEFPSMRLGRSVRARRSAR